MQQLGQIHLVRCRCILPQFKNRPEPLWHEFPVFSIIIQNDDGTDLVKPKLAQCNYCGAVHKVIDLCKSEIINGKDDSKSIVTIDEVKKSLVSQSPRIVEFLDQSDVNLPNWEKIRWIIEQQRWGEFVVISSDVDAGTQFGKIMTILGLNLFKIDEFMINKEITR